jgi:hypothetical protein
VGLAIPLNVFKCAFQFDAVALQKSIDLHPGFVTQQLAELDSRNLTFAVRCQGQGLKGRAG